VHLSCTCIVVLLNGPKVVLSSHKKAPCVCTIADMFLYLLFVLTPVTSLFNVFIYSGSWSNVMLSWSGNWLDPDGTFVVSSIILAQAARFIIDTQPFIVTFNGSGILTDLIYQCISVEQITSRLFQGLCSGENLLDPDYTAALAQSVAVDALASLADEWIEKSISTWLSFRRMSISSLIDRELFVLLFSYSFLVVFRSKSCE